MTSRDTLRISLRINGRRLRFCGEGCGISSTASFQLHVRTDIKEGYEKQTANYLAILTLAALVILLQALCERIGLAMRAFGTTVASVPHVAYIALT